MCWNLSLFSYTFQNWLPVPNLYIRLPFRCSFIKKNPGVLFARSFSFEISRESFDGQNRKKNPENSITVLSHQNRSYILVCIIIFAYLLLRTLASYILIFFRKISVVYISNHWSGVCTQSPFKLLMTLTIEHMHYATLCNWYIMLRCAW